MAFPSTISTLATPQATDRLNNPSHSTLHQYENTAITEVQTFIGTLSSAVGTILYDVRSPDSNGGGHVQTAVKGGTGQTNFNKGDILVGQSSSVLSKVAVGTDGQVLQADSGQSNGVKWSAVAANKTAIVASTLAVSGVNTVIPFFSASVLGSTLGTNNAIRFTVGISSVSQFSSRGVNFNISYGNNTYPTLSATNSQILTGLSGVIQGMIIANGSETSQKMVANLSLAKNGDGSVLSAATYGTSSTISSANQLLSITAQNAGANTFGSIIGEFLVIEKIV